LFDFSDADIWDKLWWRKLRAALLGLQMQHKRENLQAAQVGIAALLACPHISSDCVSDNWQQYADKAAEWRVAYLPNAEQVLLEQRKREYADGMAKWRERYGDPDSVEVQSRIDRKVAEMLSR